MLAFECADGRRGGGLRDAEQLGRLGHVAMLGDGDEYAQLIEGHG